MIWVAFFSVKNTFLLTIGIRFWPFSAPTCMCIIRSFLGLHWLCQDKGYPFLNWDIFCGAGNQWRELALVKFLPFLGYIEKFWHHYINSVCIRVYCCTLSLPWMHYNAIFTCQISNFLPTGWGNLTPTPSPTFKGEASPSIHADWVKGGWF